MVLAGLVSLKASCGFEMSLCLLAVSSQGLSSGCAHPWHLCVLVSSFRDTRHGGWGPTPKPHFSRTFKDLLPNYGYILRYGGDKVNLRLCGRGTIQWVTPSMSFFFLKSNIVVYIFFKNKCQNSSITISITVCWTFCSCLMVPYIHTKVNVSSFQNFFPSPPG